LARQLRSQQDTNAVSLIAVSGYGHEEAKKRARDAGFDEYLVKPANLEDISAAVEKLAARAGSAGTSR
ncbi:MAG TPA: hybrid sensor histidine kinase/response regulator, partial [Burkholderiales bacterium]|nr:hybrid sensor histidine kinase/response regulator [Burkholderiales bacterium]